MLSVLRVDYIIALDLFLYVLVLMSMSKFPQFKISEAARTQKNLASVKQCFGS